MNTQRSSFLSFLRLTCGLRRETEAEEQSNAKESPINNGRDQAAKKRGVSACAVGFDVDEQSEDFITPTGNRLMHVCLFFIVFFFALLERRANCLASLPNTDMAGDVVLIRLRFATAT